MQGQLKNECGNRYGMLSVISVAPSKNGYGRWVCQCNCGKTVIVTGSSLRQGNTKSCGCLKPIATRLSNSTHGESGKSPEYEAWSQIKRRCFNPNSLAFCNYGGRGISMNERWVTSFEAFLVDMGRRPSSRHSIDRINNDGNYEPENCRWATSKQQNNNRRDTRMFTMNGETMSLTMWAERRGILKGTLWRRVSVMAWDFDRAISTPVRRAS